MNHCELHRTFMASPFLPVHCIRTNAAHQHQHQLYTWGRPRPSGQRKRHEISTAINLLSFGRFLSSFSRPLSVCWQQQSHMVTASASRTISLAANADWLMINNNELYLIAKTETFTRLRDLLEVFSSLLFSVFARTHLFADDA